MKETVTVPTARVYKDNLKRLIANNNTVISAWFDDDNHPTRLHVQPSADYKNTHTAIPAPLRDLPRTYHKGPRRPTKRMKET